MKTTNKPIDRIAWNTGRTYSEYGQRCAAIAHNGGVVFADYDRGINHWLPECELSPSAIMARYDANDRTEHWDRTMDPEAWNELRNQAEQLAKAYGSN